MNTKGLNLTLFKNSRRFYLLYPQVGKLFGISPTPSDLSGESIIYATLSHEFETFKFLGLNAKDVVTESDLENALIDHLQEFLLELGKGFCFEDKQKGMIIDDEYYFADLVFYHRILHCSIIVELKNDEFKHEYLGQLNAYVSYYKENEIYAIADMDNQLFVSTYMLQLPDKSTLEKFLLEEIELNH